MVKAWENLHTNLPNSLRHFAKDIAHLEFFKNNDVKDALTWIKNNKDHLFDDYPDLTPGEIVSLNYYTTNNGYQINIYLRNGLSAVKPEALYTQEHVTRYLNFLDGAFEKLPSYDQGSLFLRMERRNYTELYDAFSNNLLLDYPNFISLAKNNESSFIDGGKWLNVLFEVQPNHGFKQIDMQPFSRAEGTDIGDELEVLVIRGKKMKVDGIEYKNFPSEEEVMLEAWITNDYPSGFLDSDGNVIPINPNAIPAEDFYSNNFTAEQYNEAIKILTLSIRIVNQ